jgi:hypothetical protein
VEETSYLTDNLILAASGGIATTIGNNLSDEPLQGSESVLDYFE